MSSFDEYMTEKYERPEWADDPCVEADDECFGPVIDGLCNRHRFDPPVPCVACGRTDLPLHVSGRCPECEPLWAVVASHEGHYDYVLTDGLTEADARERAEHEGDPFYAIPMTEIYR